jgi:hypothetical protein
MGTRPEGSSHVTRRAGRRTGRRELLQISAAGGLTLASGLLGALGGAARAEAGAATGNLLLSGGKLRRVVSAHKPDGTSYIAIDDAVEFASIWSTRPGKALGEAGTDEPPGLGNATGQMRCFVAIIAPSKDPKPTMANRIGYHKGAGISYCLILNGSLTYMVDTQETVVSAGDLVIERATLHSWRNDSATPVSMFIVTVSAA